MRPRGRENPLGCCSKLNENVISAGEELVVGMRRMQPRQQPIPRYAAMDGIRCGNSCKGCRDEVDPARSVTGCGTAVGKRNVMGAGDSNGESPAL